MHGHPPILRPELRDGAIVLVAPFEGRVISPKGVRLKRPRAGVRLRYVHEGTFQVDSDTLDVFDGGMRDGGVSVTGVTPSAYEAWSVLAESKTTGTVAFAILVRTGATVADWRIAGGGADDDGWIGVDTGTVGIGGAAPPDQPIINGEAQWNARNSYLRVLERSGPFRAPECPPEWIWHGGFGDGTYRVYCGHASSGEPCAVAVDFAVITGGMSGRVRPMETMAESLQFAPMTRWDLLCDWARSLW